MTIFVFESMTQAQADTVTSRDMIVFSNTAITANNVVLTQTNTALTVTAGTVTRMFAPLVFGPSSDPSAVLVHFAFTDQSTLLVGTPQDDGGNNGLTALQTTASDVIYGFAGKDSIDGGMGNDDIYGGAGGDLLNGSAGADHIYGNARTSQQGEVDGDDELKGGDGGDYLQGNAGNDTLRGEGGSDRLVGGMGNDVLIGEDGNDSLNGNVGNDTLTGGSQNDVVRGGQGNDFVAGEGDNDQVSGDLGDDIVSGGFGFDVITGGAGNDVFLFGQGEASSSNIGATGDNANLVDVVTDFVNGSDIFNLNTNSLTTLLLDTQGTTVSTPFAAMMYAQGLMNANNASNNTEIVALQVGADTYVFASYTATTTGAIDTAIRLVGVTVSQIDKTDFFGLT